jgi:DNA-binding XRE family transcriptional regulator
VDAGSKSATRILVQQRTGRELPELLRELYVEKRHTQQEIAQALGVHRMTVAEWLAEFGISRDDRPAVTL